jgi:hypothetical protein
MQSPEAASKTQKIDGNYLSTTTPILKRYNCLVGPERLRGSESMNETVSTVHFRSVVSDFDVPELNAIHGVVMDSELPRVKDNTDNQGQPSFPTLNCKAVYGETKNTMLTSCLLNLVPSESLGKRKVEDDDNDDVSSRKSERRADSERGGVEKAKKLKLSMLSSLDGYAKRLYVENASRVLGPAAVVDLTFSGGVKSVARFYQVSIVVPARQTGLESSEGQGSVSNEQNDIASSIQTYAEYINTHLRRPFERLVKISPSQKKGLLLKENSTKVYIWPGVDGRGPTFSCSSSSSSSTASNEEQYVPPLVSSGNNSIQWIVCWKSRMNPVQPLALHRTSSNNLPTVMDYIVCHLSCLLGLWEPCGPLARNRMEQQREWLEKVSKYYESNNLWTGACEQRPLIVRTSFGALRFSSETNLMDALPSMESFSPT